MKLLVGDNLSTCCFPGWICQQQACTGKQDENNEETISDLHRSFFSCFQRMQHLTKSLFNIFQGPLRELSVREGEEVPMHGTGNRTCVVLFGCCKASCHTFFPSLRTTFKVIRKTSPLAEVCFTKENANRFS